MIKLKELHAAIKSKTPIFFIYKAIDNFEGKSKLAIGPYTYLSTLQPELYSPRQLNMEFEEFLEVEVSTLNKELKNFQSELKSGVNNLLVIDTQGTELKVLEGATEILSNFDLVICEFDHRLGDKHKAVDEFLKNHKFFKIDEYFWDFKWGDVLYSKKRLKRNFARLFRCFLIRIKNGFIVYFSNRYS